MTESPFSLQGKTILVTGASSGIGRGIAIACSNMGAKIIALARNKNKLDETLAKMTQGEHVILVCDLTNQEDVEKVVEKLPKLDGIVHCAGIGQRLLCKELDGIDIDKVMDVNFRAPVIFQSILLKYKKVNKGASIVFIASIATWSPSIGNSIYSASKGAVVSYANCLALELASRQIRVNCISPAMVRTDLVYNEGLSEELLKEDEKRYPLKRYGTPEDIAYLAVYMLSDASSWMTGSNVKISGGAN